MPRVVFIQPDGTRQAVDASSGLTLMEAARQNNVPGVIAQCGGACACATCHVYVGRAWWPKLEPPEEMEEGMLDTAWERRDDSRLSCQVQLSDALDGMEATVPARQA